MRKDWARGERSLADLQVQLTGPASEMSPEKALSMGY